MDNEEILAFINKAETKLKHSKTLFKIEGYADSVSLSYYSMFLCAKALLIKKECNIPALSNIYGDEFGTIQNLWG